jgi:protein TonB
MKQHRLLALAIACLILTPIALCQDDSTKAAPEPIYRVGGSVKAPHATYAPDPKFPEKERSARRRGRGTVLLWLVVNSDGLPGIIKVSRKLSPEFDKAAIDAVKKWKFSPATQDGKPVAVEINVEVNFHLY